MLAPAQVYAPMTLDAKTSKKVTGGVALSVLVPLPIVGVVLFFVLAPLPGMVSRSNIPGLRAVPTLRELPVLATSVAQVLPTPGKLVRTPSFARLETSLAGDGLFQDVRHMAVDGQGNVYALWDRPLLKHNGSTGKLLARFSPEKNQLGEPSDYPHLGCSPSASSRTARGDAGLSTCG